MKASLFSTSFSQGPRKTWEDPMSYPAIKGLTRLVNLTLSDFNRWTCGDGGNRMNYVWMTSPKYGDIIHPMNTQQIQLFNVAERSKVRTSLKSFHMLFEFRKQIL